MRALGLDYVRIGEFAWSRIEPSRNQFQFAWLDNSIEILAEAGLKIVFGTPTATPPKWLIDEHPDILPADPETGITKGFGSRRHYDFSSGVYLQEALRISEVLAKRYGTHDAIVGWQTDNELCCHDTALSGSDNARRGFQQWCANEYGSIDALNTAWGTIFWSMEYTSFDAIELPFGAVTETSPAHQLAFRRYASDMVKHFHTEMVKVIRRHAPGKWITHNFIPKEDLYTDPYAIGQDLDIASYDNYPLGRSDMAFADAQPDVMRRYMRTGHPDFASFYHDTTRSFAGGPYWVMEQQPGPVNWAPHNPRPAPGMVRFWSLEAFAHGADCVSYFRWRQVPFAQEQMHAGLKRRDNSPATAWAEVEQVRHELDALEITNEPKAPAAVAIITDVQALWVSDIEQQGAGYKFTKVEFAYYSALRRLGLDVDFISKDADFDDYNLVIAPCLPIIDADFIVRCKASRAHFVFGPRSGSKTHDFSIPETLAPGLLQDLIDIKILSVETLRPDCAEPLMWGANEYEVMSWCEELAIGPETKAIVSYAGGEPAIASQDSITYIGTLTSDAFLQDFFKRICGNIGITTMTLPDDMRIVRRGKYGFVFNYADQPQKVPLPADTEFVMGTQKVNARDICVWRIAASGQ